MALLVIGVSKTPVGLPTAPSDRVKIGVLRVLPEIIVQPEEEIRRTDAGKQTSILKCVYMNEAIQIYLTKGDPHPTKKLFE